MPYSCDDHCKDGPEDECPLCQKDWVGMDNVQQLGVVPKPRAEDKIQREISGHLSRMQELCAEGQLDCIFIIAAHPDGTYSEAISSTTQFRQMIGQVEVVKQNWINAYLASLAGTPGPTHGK